VDRPLTEPRHWRRSAGRLVSVPVGRPDGEQVSLVGRILAADEQNLSLDVDGSPQRYGWDEVGAGRIQIEFSRPGEQLPAEEEA
jgi:ribosome maturation factor RimP